jgi:hypothetical protein
VETAGPPKDVPKAYSAFLLPKRPLNKKGCGNDIEILLRGSMQKGTPGENIEMKEEIKRN